MNTAPWFFVAALTGLVPCSAIRAQGPQDPQVFSCIGHGVGLQPLDDGTLYGIGPRYRARFSDDGFELTPASGRAAPRATPLRFSMTEVCRGSSVTGVATATPVPSYASLRVEYDRGACVERYELREDGVEQSFVFERLPPGTGDLVVRGRFACELPATTVDGGLDFEMAGVGRFRVGEITGVAADGARAEGTMRMVGDVLELSLPAAFVADAALPLVLDPLIGGVITVNDPMTRGDDKAPRAAYDAATDRYLVVCQDFVTGATSEIIGSFVSGSGTLLSGGHFISDSLAGNNEDEPAVAHIQARGAFLVTYRRNSDVIARAVGPVPTLGLFLQLSSEVVVGGGPTFEHGADLADATDASDDKALCVWKSDATSRTEPDSILAREVGIDASFNVTLGPVFTVAGNGHEQPRISRNGGAAHRFAIVTSFSAATGNHDPYVTIVDGRGQPFAPPAPISTSTRDEIDPAVDGDGTTWVAAWTSVFAANDGDVKARAFAFDPATGSVTWNSGEAIVIGARNDDERQPSVCWTGGSCLVGFRNQLAPGSPIWDGYVKSIDLLHCTACEGFFWLGRNFGANFTPQVVCKAPGVQSLEDALIVWESRPTTAPSVGRIVGQLWRSQDGNAVEVAASCGKGGTCYTSCARVGYSSFAFELRAAVPSSPTVFLMSGFTLPVFSCGSCNLVPNPSGGVALVLSTDAHGAASVPLALPNDPILRTLSLYTQWATVNTVSPACPQLGLDMSNALKVTLE